MRRELDFDLRRDQRGGYSGGSVLQDDHGSISFVQGNHGEVEGRRYVLVHYDDFRLTCDREDFPGLTKESSINLWYVAAVKLLIGKIGPVEFMGLVDIIYANGKQAGADEAREEIRRALGIPK